MCFLLIKVVFWFVAIKQLKRVPKLQSDLLLMVLGSVGKDLFA